MNTEVPTWCVPMAMTPERKVRTRFGYSVVFPGEMAAGCGYSVPSIGDDLGARGWDVRAVNGYAMKGGSPYVPAFYSISARDGVSEVRRKPLFEFASVTGMGLCATNDDPVVYDLVSRDEDVEQRVMDFGFDGRDERGGGVFV